MSLMSFISRLLRGPYGMSPAEFMKTRDAADHVIDVRSSAEYEGEHLAGALHLNVQAPDFEERFRRLVDEGAWTNDDAVYLYCRSGARSGRATAILRRRGFARAFNVGGIGALKAAGAKVERQQVER